MIDSRVVEQLQGIGFSQARYMPLWYTDPQIFHPLEGKSVFRHDLAFAGTITSYKTVLKQRNNQVFKPATNQLANNFIQQRRASDTYVDVFDFLQKSDLDIFAQEFSLISNCLLFEQKAIEREQLLVSLANRTIDIYGDYTAEDHTNVTARGCLPKEKLYKVYGGSKINLCCTQWSRCCHQRVFQAVASKGFILHENKADIPPLFEPGKEIILYNTLEEQRELIDYYLCHGSERTKIIEAAFKRFHAEHLPGHRLAAMIANL